MKILFTGGGTAGHVMPNIALIRRFAELGWDISYIGSKNGIEKELIGALPNVDYYEISSGKLRRYLSIRNLSDPFRVQHGYHQSLRIMRKVQPDVVFSKGGYVSLPVVAAAKNASLFNRSKKIKVIAHESDYTPGLANRLAKQYCDVICVTFEDTLHMIKKCKAVYTGTPIRPELMGGSREKGLSFAGLDGKKPVLLVMGGSTGAQHMNELVRETLDYLLDSFDVIHLCGKGKVDASVKRDGYVQFEYISAELPDLFAAADAVISRAGANAVFELLALKKPSVLIPLPLTASRGDQILNAKYFEGRGMAVMIDQDKTSPAELNDAVREVYRKRLDFIKAMESDAGVDGTEAVMKVILGAVGK